MFVPKHDRLGRFARTGSVSVSAAHSDKRAGNRVLASERSGGAFQPPTPASRRRADKARVTGAASGVRDLFARDPRALTSRERSLIEFQSPRKRKEQIDKTGSPRMSSTDAINREVAAVRQPLRPVPAVAVTTGATGKKRVIRDTGVPLGAKLTSRGKQRLLADGDTQLIRSLSTKPKRRPRRP